MAKTNGSHIRNQKNASKPSTLNTIFGVVGEVLLIFAAVCALYIAWQLWWTGVEAEKVQLHDSTTSSWTAPASKNGSVSIAPDNSPDTAPVEQTNWKYGDTLGKLYAPRFGQDWSRTVVEGTDNAQLVRHGLGHYSETQKPGQLGNFAVAGHRAGYGEPLGNADKLTNGDFIVMRTENYWYVYKYDKTEIVLPDSIEVLSAVPGHFNAEPTERYITLTTCEPKYTTATHRLIVYGKLVSWSKVSDGVPSVLAQKDASGKVSFTTDSVRSLASRISDLSSVFLWILVIYLVIAIAAAVAWRWPAIRSYREREESRQVFSLFGWFMRAQPGILPVRIVLALLIVVALTAALFQWGYPWLSVHVPYLQVSSNYVAVG